MPEPEIKDVTCNLYFGDEIIGTKKFSHISRVDMKWFCQFYVPINDVLRLPPQQRLASCDYTLKDDPNPVSPRSERRNLAGK